MSETIEEKCLLKGVKLTDQRKIIAQVMSQSSDHPDAVSYTHLTLPTKRIV